VSSEESSHEELRRLAHTDMTVEGPLGPGSGDELGQQTFPWVTLTALDKKWILATVMKIAVIL
jgi:hypothetical protein